MARTKRLKTRKITFNCPEPVATKMDALVNENWRLDITDIIVASLISALHLPHKMPLSLSSGDGSKPTVKAETAKSKIAEKEKPILRVKPARVEANYKVCTSEIVISASGNTDLDFCVFRRDDRYCVCQTLGDGGKPAGARRPSGCWLTVKQWPELATEKVSLGDNPPYKREAVEDA